MSEWSFNSLMKEVQVSMALREHAYLSLHFLMNKVQISLSSQHGPRFHFPSEQTQVSISL